MKQCNQCGLNNPDTSSFCSGCGAPLPAAEQQPNVINQQSDETVDNQQTNSTQQNSNQISQQNYNYGTQGNYVYQGAPINSKKTKSNAAIILALIFFFPLGLYWMWAKSNWNKVVKIVITVLIALLFFVGIFSGGSDTEDTSTVNSPVSDSVDANTTEEAAKKATEKTTEKITEKTTAATTEPTTSKKEYKKACKKYAYKDIARNPNDYKGKLAKFTGQVVQVQESSFLGVESVNLRVNVTAEENQFADGGYLYSDTVYVTYYRTDESESRILEDDIVTIYGELTGIETYTSVTGASISIPSMTAEYIDINN